MEWAMASCDAPEPLSSERTIRVLTGEGRTELTRT
jgi:hypothetical protein